MTLTEKIMSLRRSRGCVSNLSSLDFVDKVTEFYMSDGAVAAAYDDHGVKRIVFCAAAPSELPEMLSRFAGREFVAEIVARDPEENRALLESCGFEVLAELRRLSTPDCTGLPEQVTQYFDASVGYFPKTSEAREMNQFLWETFDTRVSRLLSDEEVSKVIEKKEITLHRDSDGNIDALLQVVMQPRKFYINQIINRGERKTIHAMLQNRLREYVSGGGRYAYAWVETGNAASNKFHGKYGFRHDGLYNIVYTKRA